MCRLKRHQNKTAAITEQAALLRFAEKGGLFLKKWIAALIAALMLVSSLAGCKPQPEEPSSGPQSDASETEEEKTFRAAVSNAYLYALPLMLTDTLREYMTNTEKVTVDKAPYNTFCHRKRPLTGPTKGLIRPNADALQSQAVLDLTAEPDVLVIPDGKFFTLSFYDSWGERILTLDRPGTYILRGPDCEGSYAYRQAKEIVLPDNRIICIVQIVCDSNLPPDLDRAREWQEQMKLFPFSVSPDDPPKGFYDPEKRFDPKRAVLQMSVTAYFRRYNELAALVGDRNIPLQLKDQMADLGIGAGLQFNPASFPLTDRLFLETLPLSVFDELAAWETENQHEKIGWWVERRPKNNDDIRRRALDILHRCYPADPKQMMTAVAWTDNAGNSLKKGEYELTVSAKDIPRGTIWSIGIYTRNGRPVYSDGRCSYLSTCLKPDESGTYRLLISETKRGDGIFTVTEDEFTVFFRVYGYAGSPHELTYPMIFKELPLPVPTADSENLAAARR